MYERARPGYPPEAMAWIADRLRASRARSPGDPDNPLQQGIGELIAPFVPPGRPDAVTRAYVSFAV